MESLYAKGTLVGHRYRIARLLGQGGMGAVFLAEDRLTEKLVALKSVLPSSRRETAIIETADPLAPTLLPRAAQHEAADRNSLELRLALSREFATLASLRHPHIVSVLDYGFDNGRSYFTMEYLPHSRELLSAARQSSLYGKVLLLAQIAQALAYLHRRRILHRDLKPANVLVVSSATEQHAKVLDFGLALPREHSVNTPDLAGTLAYMAPELLLGAAPGEASDLYALGVIAYEILSDGNHAILPSQSATLEALVGTLLSREFDMSQLDAPKALRELIARLVSRDLAQRPCDAAALIGELHRAVDLPPPIEQNSIRESYLQAASFVSRKAELQSLLSALRNALRGHGGFYLVGGESGVGKSRLLDEVRTRALVHGARVLRGQAVREGGTAFHVLCDALELLCLNLPIEDQALSVLVPILPRLPALLQRSVEAAPALDARSTQERTLGTLERLLESALANSAQPIIILLEDLQWAGKESLSLLARLSTWTARAPLLLIATYRDDEAPELPAQIPDAEVLKLRRLDAADIAALGESMLGAAGNSAALVELLQRESEGNPFFVVEILRTLAEEAGNLDAIAQRELPAQILTGGVRAVLEHRLNRLPAWARPLLDLAAVVGRQIEPELLVHAAIAQEMGHTIDSWLLHCADLSIIEVRDQRWRFSHDKLRECALEQLRAASRIKAAHAAVAQAMERANCDITDGDHALPFAHHLIAAVPLVSAEKALPVALKAAAQMVKRLAFTEAANLLECALPLTEHEGADERKRCEILLLLGQARIRGGEVSRGKRVCEQAAELSRRIGDPQILARAAIAHGAEFTPGQFDRSLIALLEEALHVLPAGDDPLRVRALARLAAALQPAPDPQEPMVMAREAVATARRLQDSDLLRTVLMSACSALATFAHPRERRPLNEELIQLATAAQDRLQVQRGHLRLVFDCVELGDLQGVDANIEAYAALSREFRQIQYQWPERLLRGMRAMMQGHFAEGEALATEAEALGRRAADPNIAIATLFHWGLLRATERRAELMAFEPKIVAMFTNFKYTKTFQTSFAVSTRVRAGELADVASMIKELRHDLGVHRTPWAMNLLSEACFIVGDRDLAQVLFDGMLDHADRFFTFGFTGMFVEPPYTQPLGLLAMTLGRNDDAVRYLEDALERSCKMGLRSHLARLRYQLALALLARDVDGDKAKARVLLQQARELATTLQQLGLLPQLDATAHKIE